jgi:hypothetical protein
MVEPTSLGRTTCGIGSVTKNSTLRLPEDLDAPLRAPSRPSASASARPAPWDAPPAIRRPQNGPRRANGRPRWVTHPEVLTSSNKHGRAIGLLTVAAAVVLALAACGTTTSSRPSSRSATTAKASCTSAYVDWLDLSRGVKCDQAKDVASAIFMGDDGNERTSFMKEDFSALPTVKVAGVGYLPTRILGAWHCRYSTRRSSYDPETDRPSFDANGTLGLLYATCRLDARVVKMTTTMNHAANRRNT